MKYALSPIFTYSLMLQFFVNCNFPHKEKQTETSIQQEAALIKINGGNVNSDTCVQISYDLEKDEHYNKLLGSYVCHYLWGVDTVFAETKLKEMVDRSS